MLLSVLYCFPPPKVSAIHFLARAFVCNLLSEKEKAERSHCLGAGPQPDVEAGDSAAGELAVHQQTGEAAHAADQRNQQAPRQERVTARQPTHAERPSHLTSALRPSCRQPFDRALHIRKTWAVVCHVMILHCVQNKLSSGRPSSVVC